MRRHTTLAITLPSLVLVSAVALAQTPTVGRTQQLSFDRPEAWALKRTSSLTLLTTLGPPPELAAGELELAVDLVWNPSLDERQRRVGFTGNKDEDLNRLALIPRPRLRVGLGRGVSLDVAYSPPVEVEGLRPNLLAVGLERPLWRGERWALGARVFGQMGTVSGDITCPSDVAALEPGAPGNEYGCEAPSDDEMTLDHAGLGLTGGYRWPGRNAGAIHLGLLATYSDLAFQVDALTSGVHDRNRLVTDGWTWAALAGGSWPLSGRVRLGVEALYTPLEVVRPPATTAENDDLLHLRSMLSYSF